HPGERCVEREPRDVRQGRILIVALEVAERDVAGDDARELESGAGLAIAADGIALEAEEVGFEIMHALVGADLEERLDAGMHLVGAAQLSAVAVELTVLV